MLTLLIIVACILFVISILIVLYFNYWGVLIASTISSLFIVFCIQALRGYGSPTGGNDKLYPLSFLASTFIIWLLVSLVFYLGIYFVKAFFTSEHFPKVYFLIWISLVGIGALGYTVWQISFHLSERDFNVEFGYDDIYVNTFGDSNLTAIVKSGSEHGSIKMYLNSDYGIVNQYGFKYSTYGIGKIHFAPKELDFKFGEIYTHQDSKLKELDVKFLELKMIVISVPQNTKTMTLYLNKNGELYVYADKILIETHRLKE